MCKNICLQASILQSSKLIKKLLKDKTTLSFLYYEAQMKFSGLRTEENEENLK